MTVRAERTSHVAAPPAAVWEYLIDPRRRAEAISVVEEYTVESEDPERVVWEIDLPLKLLRRAGRVRTETKILDAPEHVKFTGESRLLTVTGEHFLEPADDGTRVRSRFVVDGKLPGVETFFRRNLDDELDNIERAMRATLEASA
jgi:carbon monoxide dehydrogenase subunit G